MSTTDELTKSYSGIFGNQVVLKNRRGKSVMTMPPRRIKPEPTEKQKKVREELAKAARYAKNMKLNPDLLAIYAERAVKGMPAFRLAMTDYLRHPSVREILTPDYAGQPGNTIHVDAYDDFAVKEVTVEISDSTGRVIEKGTCVIDQVTGSFDYTATVEVPSIAGVVITAQAFDYPGHTGSLSVTL